MQALPFLLTILAQPQIRIHRGRNGGNQHQLCHHSMGAIERASKMSQWGWRCVLNRSLVMTTRMVVAVVNARSGRNSTLFPLIRNTSRSALSGLMMPEAIKHLRYSW